MKEPIVGISAVLLTFVAAVGAPSFAMANLIVPGAQTTFHSDCAASDISFGGLGSVPISCSNVSVDGSGFATGTAKTFMSPDGPVATTDVTVTAFGTAGGIDRDFGIQLIYYVGLDTVAPPPFLPSIIPVTFGAFAGVFGEGGANASIESIVSSTAEGFSNVSGVPVHIEIDQNAANLLNEFLAKSGDLIFDPAEGPAIARIRLNALCGGGGALQQGFSSMHVTCTADPLVGFDQAAFDALEGSKTFPLANYFTFVFSDGLTAASPVPEPSTFVLVLFAGLLALTIRGWRWNKNTSVSRRA